MHLTYVALHEVRERERERERERQTDSLEDTLTSMSLKRSQKPNMLSTDLFTWIEWQHTSSPVLMFCFFHLFFIVACVAHIIKSVSKRY